MDETLVVQKEYLCRALHHLIDGVYRGSYFIDSEEDLEEILRAFLNLEDWEPESEKRFKRGDWTILVESRSGLYIRSILEILAEADIPATVQSTDWYSCCTIRARQCGSGALKVMVLDRHLARSGKVMTDLGKTMDRLYREARELEDGGDSMKALEVYSKLYGLAPDDHIVSFNMGVILFDLQRYGEAADAFSESAVSRDREIREESLQYLKEILVETPDNVNVLHTLASISMGEGEREEAGRYLSKILSIQPTDAMAHLNLGYILYEDQKEDHVALMHFRKYLEFYPEAEDRSIVEAIMEELR